MDRIKPIDIERTQIGTALFGGYKKAEVDELLMRVASEIETLLRELGQARDDLARQEKEVEGFRAQESTLKEALLLAQRAADDTRSNAHREAELIVQETLGKADRLAHELQSKISDLRWEVERLRLEKQKFLKGFRATLEEYLREVEAAEQTEATRAQLELTEQGDPTVRVV